MRVNLNVEGFRLTLSNQQDTIDWLVPAYPRALDQAFDLLLIESKNEANFMTVANGHINVLGIFERMTDEPGDEVFYLLTLEQNGKKIPIKLRQTELYKLQKQFNSYWTC